MSSDAALLAMQAPSGVPRSTFFETVTDPLLPPSKTTDMLAHFFEGVYDLRPESHLSRLLKVILGDTGTGQLRKRYTYSHLSQFILTTHYGDLDALYSGVFGLKRFVREMLPIDPYSGAATDDEWEAIDAADAGYRNRIEAFSHAIAMAGTPTGMVIAASAVLGEECRVYESYTFLDDENVYSASQAANANTYGDLEQYRYQDLEGQTYSALEGTNPYQGRLSNSRGEFIVRPLRDITDEERYHLIKVLNRLKPAEALMTIDARPAAAHTPYRAHHAAASSTYWHVQSRIQVRPEVADLYERSDQAVPVEQPRAAFSGYQGENWSYNADVTTVTSYAEDENGNRLQEPNFERVADAVGTFDYQPALALADHRKLLLGRYVSDGILAAPVAVRGEG